MQRDAKSEQAPGDKSTESPNDPTTGAPDAPKKRAAIYVVAPTKDARAMQADQLKEFIRDRGRTFIKEYREKSTARPILRALQSDAKQRSFDIVVVLSIGALAQNGPKALTIALALNKIGVVVESVQERWFHPSDPLAKYIVANDQHRQQKSRATIAAKRARGESVGTPPIGFRRGENGELEEDEYEQSLIARAKELDTEGYNPSAIATIMTNEGRESRAFTGISRSWVVRALARKNTTGDEGAKK